MPSCQPEPLAHAEAEPADGGDEWRAGVLQAAQVELEPDAALLQQPRDLVPCRGIRGKRELRRFAGRQGPGPKRMADGKRIGHSCSLRISGAARSFLEQDRDLL